ncbi:MAG: hypothetical protein ABS949_18630 [Solibacillus sp.]
MSPAENIFFLLLAFGAFVLICVSWFLLRKREKWAWIVTGVVIVFYIGWYLYYPTYREVTHEKRYEQLLVYLEETYPQQQFIIEPEVYEPGYQVGEFSVHRKDTTLAGVMLRVGEDGDVAQTSYWTKGDYPVQDGLWQTITTSYQSYSLEQQLPSVEKKGEWIDGKWTVFAVTIDERPALAFYRYEQGGYGSEPLVEAKRGEVVSAEWHNRFFVYMDEAYAKETAIVEWQGEEVVLNATDHKGKLVVLE